MVFPSFRFFLKALLIAVALGVIASIVCAGSEMGLTIGLIAAVSALAGALLSRIEKRPAEAVAEENGEPVAIFVGNLAFKASPKDLNDLFAPFGPVKSARIVRNRKTGRPRGFGFVEMPPAAAQKAMKKLDGQEFFGRPLRVREGKQGSEQEE